MIKETFLIIPRATPRPRVSKNRTYYPKNYTIYKQALELMTKNKRLTMLSGAVRAELCFYLPIPSSLSKKKRESLNGTYHTKLGDLDNFAKGILDALNGYAYNDDSQVSELTVRKIYSFNPRIEIYLRCL